MIIKCFVGYAKPPPFFGEQARWFSHLMEAVHAYVELEPEPEPEPEPEVDARVRYAIRECALQPPDANLDTLFVDVDRIGYHCTRDVEATRAFVRRALDASSGPVQVYLQCLANELEEGASVRLAGAEDAVGMPSAQGVIVDLQGPCAEEEVVCGVQEKGPV